MQDASSDKALTLLKKLRYRSMYRGCKETDKLLGEFVSKNIEFMTQADLQSLDLLLSCNDLDIYNWIMGKEPVLEAHKNMVKKVKEFHNLIQSSEL